MERAKALDTKDREPLRRTRGKIKRIKRILRKLKEASWPIAGRSAALSSVVSGRMCPTITMWTEEETDADL